VTLHQLSQGSEFIYSSHETWAFPFLLWSFPPTAAFISFPTPGYWVGASAAPAFSGLLFIYSSHGKWAFLPLLWSFPPTATFTSFPAPGCWVCAATPAFSGPLVYLQFCEGFPFPPLWCSGCPALFAACLFCCYCLLFSFFFFFPGWESVCPGGYSDLTQGCLWEYHMLLCSLCDLHLPKWYGHWCLAVWEPSWLLRLM
jgi:hypothetical protein